MPDRHAPSKPARGVASRSERRVLARVAAATRPRTVIDIGLRDRRRERPRCPVSRLGRSHLQAGPACQVHGDPTYLIAACTGVSAKRYGCACRGMAIGVNALSEEADINHEHDGI